MPKVFRQLRLFIYLVVLIFPLGCTKPDPTSDSQANSLHERSGRQENLHGRDQGIQQASEAIARDMLILKEYPPLPYPPGHNIYTALLRDRCGVTFEVIDQLPAGVTAEQFREEISGWNSTMESEIKRRFGEDIFEKLQSEAKQLK